MLEAALQNAKRVDRLMIVSQMFFVTDRAFTRFMRS
jgi:hypothetical protein